METSGHACWFERLLGELRFEFWIDDATEIRTRIRKQKTDRQDAELILRSLLAGRFPRIWVPRGENRDLWQLLWHRHQTVQARTRVMNQLRAVALNEGLRCKKPSIDSGSVRSLGATDDCSLAAANLIAAYPHKHNPCSPPCPPRSRALARNSHVHRTSPKTGVKHFCRRHILHQVYVERVMVERYGRGTGCSL
jgi:Transposase